MYILIPEICSEQPCHLYVVDCGSDRGISKICSHYYKRIIISNYSYNKFCDEYTVDMLLHLNTIDEFLISRFINVKRVQYKIHDIFRYMIAKI
jgi:hypothetical protein